MWTGKTNRLFFGLAVVAICVFSLGNSPPALTDADRSAIRDVIQRQLTAFRENDGVKAFSYAAPGIKVIFQTPAIFMKMVRASYKALIHPRRVVFAELTNNQGQVHQRVMIFYEGEWLAAVYPMQKQLDGRWLIAGCTLKKTPDKLAWQSR
ncbi:MAG: DUF4864 domain-containing protein [Nitrospinales bacterium]